MKAEKTDYNGWTNHATWELWTTLENTEQSYLYWREKVKEMANKAELVDNLKLRYSGIGQINFDEIATAMMGG